MPPTDHDLIVEHSIKIDTLCDLVETYTEKIEIERDRMSKTHKEIFLKIDKKTNDATFRWVAGILILVMISVVSFVGVGMMQVHDNGTAIKYILEVHE